MTTDIYTLHRGATPVLISLPHVGTVIPPEQRARYTPRALELEDTDWFVDRLYAFAGGLGAGLIVPRYHRYLIDLNRPRENTPLYDGRNNTELCPTRNFSGEPLYRGGQTPDATEIRRRVARYWRPYHDALGSEIERLRAVHGHAVLLDAHSIKSELPWLFAGTLPHLNLGTVDGASCAASLRERLTAVLAAQSAYTVVVDARFKGGYTTRCYGRPEAGSHALQIELSWRAYLDETQRRFEEARAVALTPLLGALVQTMIDWRPP